MWFMNKIANPFVRLILRSPLHGLMDTALLLITYRGRKSGKQYTLPTQYVQAGNVLYIVPGNAKEKTWWRNLRGGIPVQVVLHGKTLAGIGCLLDPAADAGTLLTGLQLYLQHFPSLARMYRVGVDASGTFDEADLRRAVASIVMVRVDLNHQ